MSSPRLRSRLALVATTAVAALAMLVPSAVAAPVTVNVGAALTLTGPNQAYGLSSLHARGYKGQGQRIAVIENDGFSRADLETAGACFGYKPPPTPVKLVDLKKPLPPGTETTLDLQTISASAPEVKSIQVIEGSPQTPILSLVAAALETPIRYRASVISSSLGTC